MNKRNEVLEKSQKFKVWTSGKLKGEIFHFIPREADIDFLKRLSGH